jgi:hypothetical protein
MCSQSVRETELVPLFSGDEINQVPEAVSYLSNAALTIEGRLLRLVKESTQGAVPLDDFLSELSLLLKDLRRCYRQVVDLRERRDLSYKAAKELQEMEERCVWLYRKIHSEQTFFRKYHLEAKLRSMISAEAFAVYQELLNVEEQEQTNLLSDDSEVRRALERMESNFSPT